MGCANVFRFRPLPLGGVLDRDAGVNYSGPNAMESQLDALKFRVLEERLQRSERCARLSVIGWGITAALLIAAISTGTVHARQPQTDKLRVRELAVVDEQGRERIVLAAPLPNPIVNGKVEKRIRVVSAGVQF